MLPTTHVLPPLSFLPFIDSAHRLPVCSARGCYDAIFLDVTAAIPEPSAHSSASAPPASLCTASALGRLRLRLREDGGTLIVNALGTCAHVDDVREAMRSVFNASIDVIRVLTTTEDNTVFVGVRYASRASSAAARMDRNEHVNERREHGEPLGWSDACAMLGLVVERP